MLIELAVNRSRRAEKLITIVPDAAPVLIEAWAEHRDVEFVHPGGVSLLWFN